MEVATLMKRFVFSCLSVTLAAGLLAATPASKAPPMGKLPPGMTPAILQMMMTLPKGPHPSVMPAGTVPVSGCIPTMGYHYAKPSNFPFGPIYGYYNGKATFTEVMVDKGLFEKGSSWNEILKPLPGYKIDHVDIWYESHGHPGYTIPHYDIHAWYIPHAQHMTFCGNTSGKRPAFLM
jgi:hypothetical protein